MYAVIQTGGKQYRVAEGDRLAVERLTAEAGSSIELSEVLMLVDGDEVQVGKPYVQGASVGAVVKEHGRMPKIRIVKFKRRKHYRRQMGHRQNYTLLEITKVGRQP